MSPTSIAIETWSARVKCPIHSNCICIASLSLSLPVVVVFHGSLLLNNFHFISPQSDAIIYMIYVVVPSPHLPLFTEMPYSCLTRFVLYQHTRLTHTHTQTPTHIVCPRTDENEHTHTQSHQTRNSKLLQNKHLPLP